MSAPPLTGNDDQAPATGGRYLLFAGTQPPPNGGLGDPLDIFTSEEAARRAFRDLRLRMSSPTSWAQLAVLDARHGLKPMCWFGLGAEPQPRQSFTKAPQRNHSMSKTPPTPAPAAAPPRRRRLAHSRTFTAGLATCALLAVADVAMAFDVSDDAPPLPVLLSGALLGLLTLYGVRQAWAGAPRGVTVIVVTRVLSALSGIPAFFVDDAPEWAPPVVALCIVLTVAGVGLVFRGVRQPARSVQQS